MNAPVGRVLLRAAQAPKQASRTVASYTDIVASPPQVRVSFPEKVGHGVLLFFGVLGYPLYAISRMAEIRREEYAALEIPENWAAWKERQQK